MKRFLTVLITLGLITGLVSCSGSGNKEQNADREWLIQDLLNDKDFIADREAAECYVDTIADYADMGYDEIREGADGEEEDDDSSESMQVFAAALIGMDECGVKLSWDGEDSDDVNLSEQTLDFCDVFSSITRSAMGGMQRNPSNEQEWQERVRIVEQILQTVPTEYDSHAEIYLELVKARRDLLKPYGYVQVTEIPAEVLNTFIDEHREHQIIANELIAFSKGLCGLG